MGLREDTQVGSPTAVFLIMCPDQKGITAAVANFIFEHGGNILHADQHINVPQSFFFQRVEWELDGFSLTRDEIPRAFREIAARFGMQWKLGFSEDQPRIAIFVSKSDHCLLDLLYRSKAKEFPGEIVAVLSNHPDLAPTVARYGVPYHVFPITSENKAAQEEVELELLKSLQVDLIVLARYMQVLTGRFLQHYPNRIINIHHSFLPAFAGRQPYHQAYERGVKMIGATSHYVTEALDDGPIVEQDVCRVTHRDSVEDMIQKGRDLERRVLGRAVRLHLLHRVLPYGNKTVVFD